jgi:LmbE family N-acetylglucosaminyl deacetylase
MAASIPNIVTAQPHHPPILPIYYMDTVAGIGFEPEEYVDISDHFETKRRMLACHQSQTAWLAAHDQVDVIDMMAAVARFRGVQAGVAHAEGFRAWREWGRIATERLLP